MKKQRKVGRWLALLLGAVLLFSAAALAAEEEITTDVTWRDQTIENPDGITFRGDGMAFIEGTASSIRNSVINNRSGCVRPFVLIVRNSQSAGTAHKLLVKDSTLNNYTDSKGLLATWGYGRAEIIGSEIDGNEFDLGGGAIMQVSQHSRIIFGDGTTIRNLKNAALQLDPKSIQDARFEVQGNVVIENSEFYIKGVEGGLANGDAHTGALVVTEGATLTIHNSTVHGDPMTDWTNRLTQGRIEVAAGGTLKLTGNTVVDSVILVRDGAKIEFEETVEFRDRMDLFIEAGKSGVENGTSLTLSGVTMQAAVLEKLIQGSPADFLVRAFSTLNIERSTINASEGTFLVIAWEAAKATLEETTLDGQGGNWRGKTVLRNSQTNHGVASEFILKNGACVKDFKNASIELGGNMLVTGEAAFTGSSLTVKKNYNTFGKGNDNDDSTTGIIVKDGGTLNLESTTLSFLDERRLLVEAGGTLVLDESSDPGTVQVLEGGTLDLSATSKTRAEVEAMTQVGLENGAILKLAGYTYVIGESAYPAIIDAASMTVAQQIDANIMVIVPEEAVKAVAAYSNTAATATVPARQEFTFADMEKDAKGRYRLVIANIPAKEMTEVIALTILDKDGNELALEQKTKAGSLSGNTFNFRVTDYVNNVLLTNSDVKYQNIGKAMLNYGQMAQLQFGHKLEDLANPEGFLEAEMAAVTPNAACDIVFPEGNSEAKTKTALGYQSMALNLEGVTEVYLYFDHKVTAVDGSGKAYKVEASGSRFRVVVENIFSNKLHEMHTVIVKEGGKDYTFKVSALSYANRMLNNAAMPESLKNVCRALYLYNEAAREAFR